MPFVSQGVQGMPSSNVVLNFVPYILGDVDGNKKINISDAVRIIDYILYGTSINMKAANVNKDSKVNVSDAVAIVDMILNKQ